MRQARALFNARIDASERFVFQAYSGSRRQAILAQLEGTRAQGNAVVDALLAQCSQAG